MEPLIKCKLHEGQDFCLLVASSRTYRPGRVEHILSPDGGIQMFQTTSSLQPPGESTLTKGDILYWHLHSSRLGKL